MAKGEDLVRECVEERIAELRHESDSTHDRLRIKGALAEAEALAIALTALSVAREDAARLDWLERVFKDAEWDAVVVEFNEGCAIRAYGDGFAVYDESNSNLCSTPALRDAIDAARRADGGRSTTTSEDTQ